MELLFAGTVPKEAQYSDDNEDRYAVDAARGRLVVCDGASESFDAKSWAQILCRVFMQLPVVDAVRVAKATEMAAAQCDPATLSWSRQVAWERGSFSTLLGVDWVARRRCLRLWCVGDSLFVRLYRDGRLETLTYSSAEQFASRPQLLATIATHNAFVAAEGFESRCRYEWKLRADEATDLLLMTDALGAWLLARIAERDWASVGYLRQLASTQELAAFVGRERAAGRMRRDDSTLIVARIHPEST